LKITPPAGCMAARGARAGDPGNRGS
jgi:hypothetical protein